MSKDFLDSKVTMRLAGVTPFGHTWGLWMLLVPPAAPTCAGPTLGLVSVRIQEFQLL